MLRKPLRQIYASVRFLLIVLSLSAGSMLVSYAVVQFLVRDLDVRKSVDPATLQRANILRVFSNELASLCNGYARRIPIDTTRITPQGRQWVEKVFRPEIQFLQHRMNDTIVADLPEFLNLKSTAVRCASMARYPDSIALRSSTLREVAQSVAEIEAWIETRGVSKRLSRPPVKINYEWGHP